MTAPTTEAPAPDQPTDQPIDAPPPPSAGVPFTIPVMVLEGYRTSDDRQIRAGAIAHRALPLTLMVLDETSPAGHDGAQVGGRIETLERVDVSATMDVVTGQPYGAGVFGWRATGTFADDEEGAAFARRAAEQSLRGVSVDLAVTEYEETVLEEDADGYPTRVLFEVTAGEILGSTVCPFPAFAGAYIVVDPAAVGVGVPAPGAGASADGEAVAASAPGLPWLNITDAETCGTCPEGTLIAAGTVPDDAPPADWFTDPGLDRPTPLTVTADGRVYGHLAAWGTCHTGMPGRCVTAPRSPDGTYSHFTVGAVLCADGTQVPVGALTVAANHADLSDSAGAAIDHYAHTGQSGALVAAGEDGHGIWVAGYVPPGTAPALVAALRGHPLSGDWRPVGGQLRLVGALAVNTPGFTLPRARVASGRPMALVAAGSHAVAAAARPTPDSRDTLAFRILDELAELRRERDAERALARISRRRTPAA